jgi:hypothetical protein
MAFSVAAILKFNGAWRFTSPGPTAAGVSNDFYNLIGKVVAQGNPRQLLEHFKSYFAGAAGMVSNWSSGEGWADTDLQRYMEQATENAPLFIEAFYGACVSLASDDIHTPGAEMINQILAKHDAGYKIELPDLVVLREQTSIAVEVLPPSLSDQAQNIIQQSLQQSQEYLTAGQYRQAVQEILWLLETVSTLFQGLTIGTDTIEGKYLTPSQTSFVRTKKGQRLSAHLHGQKRCMAIFHHRPVVASGMAPIFVQTSQCKKMKLVFSAI